jgi:hypothetical protein
MSTASADQSAISSSGRGVSLGSIHSGGARLRSWWRHERSLRAAPMTTIFQVTDLLHRGHTVRVPGDEIAATVSAWLAELGAHSPLVTDLVQAVGAGDWPTVYVIGERLSVDVTVAA